MAVFTRIGLDQADELARRVGLGRVSALEPIAAGIENTNYFITTPEGRWVLTLFERMTEGDLAFCVPLMAHLAARGLPTPDPRPDVHRRLVHHLAGKPAAIVPCLPGGHVMAPDLHHVAQVGQVLARMHKAVADFPVRQPNPRSRAWWDAIVPRIRPHLSASERELLDSEMSWQRSFAASAAFRELPWGAVHADLFRDNVMFDGLPAHEKLTGIIDFYFAGDDSFAYDLAVTLNDWCLGTDGASLEATQAAALMQAYGLERRLTPGEARAMPAMLRAAALRFWLSRLGDWHLPRDAELIKPKPPQHFEQVLRARIADPWHPDPQAVEAAA